MRRKAGELVPLEVSILEAAVELRAEGESQFHGYAIAKRIAQATAAQKLTAYGTLYRALGRLEKAGALLSHWEDPRLAEGRPRRRLYSVTADGERALRRAHDRAREKSAARASRRPNEGLAPA